MSQDNRREFLAEVGQGMLVASVGVALAADLGLASTARGSETSDRLDFGELEPLVALMQETAPEKLQPLLVDKIKRGSDLKTLIAAGALANARSFGGEDYVGFHTMMALTPAWQMSKQMPRGQEALPILKVLYRNAERIQEHGGRSREVLKPVNATSLERSAGLGGEQLRASMRTGDMQQTERVFHQIAQGDPHDAFNSLQHIVHDSTDVHRVALAWRAWEVMQLAGEEHAHTLLRQSVRLCTMRERGWINNNNRLPQIRTVLPKMLDQYKLAGGQLGTKKGDDQWFAELTHAIFSGARDQAAEAAAAALADGYAPTDIAEAISAAANQLVLYDHGRQKAIERKGHSERPIGSVHGDSVGVHASDAANAWRNIAAVSNHRNIVASLIVGAYHTAGQAGRVSEQPYPFATEQESLRGQDSLALLRHAEQAIRNQDQTRSAAAVALYGEMGQSPEPVFQLLLKYAVSEDGALHAEKYFQTVTEEFGISRKKYRWNHLIGLARVTASEFGWPAPGHEDAVQRLRG